ncbi:MAG: sulfatase [Alteromonadaceae bacterium]|uniref:arylsulfatase n=1 Tax=Paraglaciecola chathamensis TaxID=368405 RepID=UPI000C5BB495|nr:arylsulfatase [Paraglaciecola agarilytica]MBN28241.1 sulfatase [Alteromonadaceae bacterium]|tara:strand:+ start:13117 stop:14961 length:1845 start_codon:yes stop_codon:yes gene_type:complete
MQPIAYFCAIVLLFSSHILYAEPEHSRPNIVLITADDLGFDDLSIHASPYISTPNIDQLARESVRFSDFTVTPVCSTTRAALLSGRDPYKTGVSGVHGGRDFMARDEVLMSDILLNAGYKTGTWGKWHIGKTNGYFPWDRGFDEGYYAELYQHQNSFGWLNGQKVTHQKWASEVVTDYAIDFIERNQTTPFFAYLSYLAPHEPWVAPKKFSVPLIKQGLRPAIANLYGMVNEMDEQIGRLLARLDALNLSDNTVVIFLSDNGPWWDSSNAGAMLKEEWHQRNPSKLKGNKGQSWQNGIKSPLFIRWKDHWQARDVPRYVDVKDILPTLTELTQAKLPATHKGFDGLSFLNYLTGESKGDNNRETYIASHDVNVDLPNFNQWTPIDRKAKAAMHFANQTIGLRTEQYKLLLNPAADRPQYPQATKSYLLFDMQQDPLESHNIVTEKPVVAKSMISKLKAKFNEIHGDPASFRPPVYQITNQASLINGFGPAATSVNVLSKPHHLSNLRQPGDFARYHIDVMSAGNYHLYIQQDNTDSAGLEISIELNEQKVTTELNGLENQLIGTLKLTPSDTEFTLEVVANNSIKPWTSISGLRRFIFVPEGKQSSFSAISNPY